MQCSWSWSLSLGGMRGAECLPGHCICATYPIPHSGDGDVIGQLRGAGNRSESATGFQISVNKLAVQSQALTDMGSCAHYS